MRTTGCRGKEKMALALTTEYTITSQEETCVRSYTDILRNMRYDVSQVAKCITLKFLDNANTLDTLKYRQAISRSRNRRRGIFFFSLNKIF